MKILFMGTPDFSVPCLKALKEAGYEIVGVATQPDKPKGRGHKMQPTPVKEYALEQNMPVFQPQTLKNGEFRDVLERLKPELLVVVAYGKILPKYVLDYPKYGAINVHASLLPKYRGAGPIQWSIINGETKTGVTTMYMEEGLDTGDMLVKTEVPIGENTTYGELHDLLCEAGATTLLKTLEMLENGTLKREKQDHGQSCYAPMINKELAMLDFTKPGQEIGNLIRGLNPYPLAQTTYMGQRMKIWEAEFKSAVHENECGTLLGYEKGNGIKVVVSDGYLYIKKLQMEGKKPMTAEAYINGNTLQENCILG